MARGVGRAETLEGHDFMTSKSAWSSFVSAVRADHRSLHQFEERYPSDRPGRRSIASDAVQRVGFQMLIAVRVMHLLRDLKVPLGKQIVSRLIRHLYSAEIHWDADISPGVTLVHGNGLVISHGARIGAGCLIFQGVTFGESFDASTGEVGAPSLGRNIHVMPNAVLIGPISIGDNTKIMANVTLTMSVDADSLVRSPSPDIASRLKPTSLTDGS
jgi:serine O-acetyltransferase